MLNNISNISLYKVLRDFALDLVDDDGDALNAEQYLDQCLRPQQGYDAGVSERNKIRRALTTFFQVCFMLLQITNGFETFVDFETLMYLLVFIIYLFILKKLSILYV